MKQEDKELLLKVLCAGLPYGVKVDGGAHGRCTLIGMKEHIGMLNSHGFLIELGYPIPYLRPMSSMTDEESKEFDVITNGEKGFYEDENGWIRCDNIHTKWGVWPKGCAEMLDWLNSHHFDYRGLIEKGLALEAPEDMYKSE